MDDSYESFYKFHPQSKRPSAKRSLSSKPNSLKLMRARARNGDVIVPSRNRIRKIVDKAKKLRSSLNLRSTEMNGVQFHALMTKNSKTLRLMAILCKESVME